MVSIEDRFLRINKLFEKASYKRPDITAGLLIELYESEPGLFGERKNKPAEMNPKSATAWRIMLSADNSRVETWDKQCNSALRIEKVIRRFGLFDLRGVQRPRDETTLLAWLIAIDDRLQDLLLDTPRRSDDEVLDSISIAFGIEKHEFVTSPLQPQKYYGYRRSANDGDIIRFYFEIKEQSDRGILRFDNFFLRSPHPWIVDGHGFSLGKLSHMMGSAKSSPSSPYGKGVRFFTLQPYEFGWLVGLLDTRDNFEQPISARIVLVPVEQHKQGKVYEIDPGNEKFTEFLATSATPEQIRADVQVPLGQEHILQDLEADELIQTLIWNGSLRTLHGEPQPIPQRRDHVGLKRLIEIQRRFLDLGKQPPNDTRIFARLLKDSDINEAILNYLSKRERLPLGPRKSPG